MHFVGLFFVFMVCVCCYLCFFSDRHFSYCFPEMEDIPRERSYVVLHLECFEMVLLLLFTYLFNGAIALEVRGGAVG